MFGSDNLNKSALYLQWNIFYEIPLTQRHNEMNKPEVAVLYMVVRILS